MNIYVSNLSFQTTEEDLKNMFLVFGEVDSAKIITDRETGRSRGFGFVKMMAEVNGRDAIQGLNNKDHEGRIMSVSIAKEKNERSYNSFSRNNSSNRKW